MQVRHGPGNGQHYAQLVGPRSHRYSGDVIRQLAQFTEVEHETEKRRLDHHAVHFDDVRVREAVQSLVLLTKLLHYSFGELFRGETLLGY